MSALTSFPSTALRFVKESRDELKKASWPTRQAAIRYTATVIIFSVIVGGLVGGFDYALQRLLELLII